MYQTYRGLDPRSTKQVEVFRTLPEALSFLGIKDLEDPGDTKGPEIERGTTTVSLPQELGTERLRLRRWRPSDRDPFAALNADPRVMEHFPSLVSREESDALAGRIESHFDQHGFGLWAVEVVGVEAFVGFIGLCIPRFVAPFTPCVEIGWRLAAQYWGQGLATEGARAALAFGFETLGLKEIVSFTATVNLRSRRVMEKLGMTHNPADDFDHPVLPREHRLSRHVLYRIAAPKRPTNGPPC
jgi:RimJ/RimL family protein N-acetyltransferase